MSRLYKIAIVCGLLPLLVGTTTFVAWLATDIGELVVFGLFVFFVGLGVFLVGVIALRRFVTRAKKEGVAHVRYTAIAAAILLLNFPAAFAYMAIADSMETSFFVTIENEFSEPIRDLVFINSPGDNFPIADIDPGSKYSHCFDFLGDGGDGDVKFSMTVNDSTRTGFLLGYITPNMGVRAKMHLTEAGQVEVSESTNRISFGELLQFCVF